eukprot:6461599-Pyramimonas_sp.AAC.1
MGRSLISSSYQEGALYYKMRWPRLAVYQAVGAWAYLAYIEHLLRSLVGLERQQFMRETEYNHFVLGY